MKKTYHKIRMKYIWSYLAIIIITCTAIISVIVFYTNNFFREKLTNFSQAQMQECIRALENVMEESRQISIVASGDRELTHSEVFSSKVREYDVLQKLSSYRQMSTNFDNILLRYMGTNELFDCGAKYNIDNISQKDELAFLSDESVVFPLPLLSKVHAGADMMSAGEQKIAITYPVPYGSSEPYAKISCLMDDEVISGIFKSLEEERAVSIFIRNAGGELFFEKNVHGVEHPQDVFDAPQDVQREFVVLRQDSDTTGISAVLLIDRKSFFSPIAAVNLIVFLITGVILAIAIACNFQLSKKNIMPIVKLREYILMNDIAEPEDDFSELFQGVQEVFSANQILTEQLQVRKRIITNNILENIAFGYHLPKLKADVAALTEMGVRLESPYYMGACVRLRSQEQTADKAALLLDDFIESRSICGRLFPVSMTENDRFVLLICSETENEAWIAETADAIRQYFQNNEIYVTVSLGYMVGKMEDIYLSVASACAIAEKDAHMTSTPGQTALSWPYIVKKQLLINQLVKINKGEEAIVIMQELIDEIASGGYTNKMTACINVVLSTVANDRFLNESEELQALIDGLMACTTPQQVGHSGAAILQYVSRQLYDQSQSQELRLFNDIVRYINDNFQNEQMSLEYVSKKFNVSIYYISKFFKNIAGYYFNQYITRLRMERAKELLASTKKTLREITVEIGYIDESSFLRKFKSNFGETPGQYRKRERG